MNVALTRAKHSLWLVSHCATLNQDALWKNLISDAKKRNLVAQETELRQLTKQRPRRKYPKKKRGDQRYK